MTVWHEAFAAALPPGARAHVKLDTGMGRLGTRDAALASRLADEVAARGQLVGAWTHFATSDERDNDFYDVQLERSGRGPQRCASAIPAC